MEVLERKGSQEALDCKENEVPMVTWEDLALLELREESGKRDQ